MLSINIKNITIMCALVILTSIFAFADNNKAKKMDENILKRRFGEFSTSEAFVLIKLKNKKTKETMDLVCENTYWADMCEKSLKLFSDSKEYTGYMVKNYNKTFEVNEKIYSALKDFKADDSYIKYSKAPWEEVKATFLKKERGLSNFFNIKDRNLQKNPDFIKMLLLHTVVVRRDCESGFIYVEE